MKKNKSTIQRNWQHRRYTRWRQTKRQSRETGNIGGTQDEEKQSRETGNIGGTQDEEKQNDNPEAT